jgi:hypothetical protein
MYILIRYILLLIMSCLPAITLQNREIINRDQQSIHKDSISEFLRPINSSEEKLYQDCNNWSKVIFINDSVSIENIQWKFRKQIILGN